MQRTTLAPDGLRIEASANLSHLATDELCAEFAEGLLVTALAHTPFTGSLAEALHVPHIHTNALLTTLLVLDADVEALAVNKRRVFPLPAFLSYRPTLTPDKFPLTGVRLPPLNPDGHYRLRAVADDAFVAARLDLHPRLNVMGHVRLAVSGPTRPPTRLQAAEHRLDRQVLSPYLIEAALTTTNEAVTPPLSNAEWAAVADILRGLVGAKR